MQACDARKHVFRMVCDLINLFYCGQVIFLVPQ